MARSKKGARISPQPPQFIPALLPCNVPTQRSPIARDQAEKRILIMRAGAFGDILMGTPLLAALRRAYPTAYITWLAEHTACGAIEANPYVDEVIVWNGGFWTRTLRKLNYPKWLFSALRFRQRLRKRAYDIFISFQPEEWPLLARNTGASTRIGIFDTFARHYGAPYQGDNARLYTHAYQQPHLPAHRVDQYFLTLDALGLPKDDLATAHEPGLHRRGCRVCGTFSARAGLGSRRVALRRAGSFYHLADQMLVAR